MTCRLCKQPAKGSEMLDGVYCSFVCKSVVKGNTRILKGNYFGITPINQNAEVTHRLKTI